MLKAMAQLIRPATERRTATRHNKSPSPPPPRGDDVLSAHEQHPKPAIARRSSRAAPPLQDDAPDATAAQQTPAKAAAPLTRTSARKRPASEIATDPRPPTKITVTQPHGELLGITNGVPRGLGIAADEVPSRPSTPAASSRGVTLAVPAPTAASSTDKRSLRSQDGGSRLKSDLATYFANYDDVMAGVPKSPGMSSGAITELG
jgi:hypothetical protein